MIQEREPHSLILFLLSLMTLHGLDSHVKFWRHPWLHQKGALAQDPGYLRIQNVSESRTENDGATWATVSQLYCQRPACHLEMV